MLRGQTCARSLRRIVWSYLLICTVAHIAPLARAGDVPDMHNALEKFNVRNLQHNLHTNLRLSANITELRHSGDWVNVSWHGVQDPQDDDYIALYAPAAAHVYKTSPVKYQWAVKAPSHRTEGAGSIRFRVLNMRTDMRFAFIRNGFEFPVLAAYSDVITVANANEPVQGHLALTGDNSEMLIQWVTKNSSNPQVQWGTAEGSWPHTAAATSITYGREDLCGGPAVAEGWLDPGLLHRAVLTGLKPGERYYCVYGDPAHGFSQVASFTAAPKIGPDSQVTFLAIADMGQAEIDGSNEQSEMIPALNTTQLMIAEADDKQLLIHNGDISYARGFSSQWDVFFDQIQPLVTKMPYMTVPGNHERDWPNSGDRFPAQYDSGGECGVPYNRRLKMPTPAEDKPWYSFDFGPIHFLQYSTEHHFGQGSEQHSFVMQDLASVDRSIMPWLVVGGHRPFYIDSTNNMEPDGDQPVAAALREAFEDAFYDYQVDMTWHGHHHSYQRTCPMYQEKCLQDNADGTAAGPVHLVIGHAGAGLCLNTLPVRPKYWERVELTHGYMRVKANGTHMHCEVIEDEHGSVMDAFTLHKPVKWLPKRASERDHDANSPVGQMWKQIMAYLQPRRVHCGDHPVSGSWAMQLVQCLRHKSQWLQQRLSLLWGLQGQGSAKWQRMQAAAD